MERGCSAWRDLFEPLGVAQRRDRRFDLTRAKRRALGNAIRLCRDGEFKNPGKGLVDPRPK